MPDHQALQSGFAVTVQNAKNYRENPSPQNGVEAILIAGGGTWAYHQAYHPAGELRVVPLAIGPPGVFVRDLSGGQIIGERFAIDTLPVIGPRRHWRGQF